MHVSTNARKDTLDDNINFWFAIVVNLLLMHLGSCLTLGFLFFVIGDSEFGKSSDLYVCG